MRDERCREWREKLGAYALGRLAEREKNGLEAHLEGCVNCRAEADSLLTVARLLPHADPDRFGPAPAPPAALGRRITAAIGAEERGRRRRRRLRVGLGGVAAAAAAVLLAIVVFSSDPASNPAQHVAFRALPKDMEISATLEPRAFGTEIHMYVKGVRSGTLCRVYMRDAGGKRISAGTFRYRWGTDASAVLSAALDLSRASALVVRAGSRTFVAPIRAETSLQDPTTEEATT
jgi:hypothetical protein